MYSLRIQESIGRLTNQINLGNSTPIPLLNETASCLIGIIGRAIDADVVPMEDILTVSIRLLLLDEGLSAISDPDIQDDVHYLIGMGFEQTGNLLSRFYLEVNDTSDKLTPLDNDHWYRLVLSFLHYLAGGHRVQALTVLRQIGHMTTKFSASPNRQSFANPYSVLQQLYSGQALAVQNQKLDYWQTLFLSNIEPNNIQEQRINRLSVSIQQRRNIVLESLGQGSTSDWLAARNINNEQTREFWLAYIQSLVRRGITTFTREQVGPGFDVWLRLGVNLLVVLPTGSGKTIIGELLSALFLASGKQIVWMLPTRALVRQAKKELTSAFEKLGVIVEELPTTEDYIPTFIESIAPYRHVSVTTPEKLSALIRANPNAIGNLGLVVFDEAQLLFKDGRGTTAEAVLQQIHHLVPNCNYVLMTAFAQVSEALEAFIKNLCGADSTFCSIRSSLRPTRRIYGIITEREIEGKLRPEALLFPPNASLTNIVTTPFRLQLKNESIPKSTLGATTIAQRFLLPITTIGLKSVFFVGSKSSTESQAREIAEKIDIPNKLITLPQFDVARLQTELGRKSIIEDTALKNIAPHHAALTEIEQVIVEKWVKEGVINTVVATPTLAEGVNLPFDMSIVSFVQRFNQATQKSEDLPLSEIQNMLGRAGRAGYVTDGICLIACKSETSNPISVLNRHRRYFFSEEDRTSEFVGLRRLITSTVKFQINREEWLYELDHVSFDQVQAIVSFVLDASHKGDNSPTVIEERIRTFPSMQLASEFEIKQASTVLCEVATNIQSLCQIDPLLIQAMMRTGMPIEILRYFLVTLRNNPTIHDQAYTYQINWCDDVVTAGLTQCTNRRWYSKLIGNMAIESIITIIRLWRAGATIDEIDRVWSGSTTNVAIKTGEFLRQQLSIIAQFWGALSVCSELVVAETNLGTNVNSYIPLIQTLVREGVSTRLKLEWLKRIGGIDRVLAHKLADVSRVVDTQSEIKRYVAQQLRIWKENEKAIPQALEETAKNALIGIIQDSRSAS